MQTGVVVQEDKDSVTVRFPREEIKSVNRDGVKDTATADDKVIWEEAEGYILLKIPRGSIVTQTRKNLVTYGNVITSEVPQEKIIETGTGKKFEKEGEESEQQKLLKEETGHVEGMITWQGRPLQNSKVKIVLERYTGFSASALQRQYAEKDSSSKGRVILETMTDSKGRYVFNETPPGFYRLYWMPVGGSDWVHRLKENPDFEVISGNVTVADVPDKKLNKETQ